GTNDGPTVTAGSTTATGSVTEDGGLVGSGNELGSETTSGTISFADVDLSDTHTVSSAAMGSDYVGSFSTTVSDDSTSEGAGTVSWTFTVSDSQIDYLAVGESLVQTYSVTVADGHGASTEQDVTITITGTN